MGSAPTHEDAKLLLQLYDLRREKVLRRARDFVHHDCKFKNFKDFQKRYPQGSKQQTYVSMVLGYWDMACTFVTKGLISEDLFNSTNFEQVGIWFRLQPLVEGWRKEYGSPDVMRSLETVATRHPFAAAAQQRLQSGGKHGKKARATAAQQARPAEHDDEDEE